MEYFLEKIAAIPFEQSKKWEMQSKEQFGILLSAPSCYARDWNVNYMEIDNIDKEEIEKLLKSAHISDKESLLADIKNSIEYGAGEDYEQFQTFWNDTPCFDIEQLGVEGRMAFSSCKSYAEKFRTLVGDGGFFAWDYSESIQVIRMGFMKGWLKYDEANELLGQIVDATCKRYDSWKTFAVSYICGGAYFTYKNFGLNEEEADKFFDVLCGIVQNLVTDQYGEYWNEPVKN